MNTTKISSKPTASQMPPSPQTLRDNAELGATQAKEIAGQMSAGAAAASDMMNKTYASAMKNANGYNAMLIDFMMVNTNHTFSFFQKLSSVRSPEDFAKLSADHARTQATIWSDQTRQLSTVMPWQTASSAGNVGTP